jgi:hypothetical protein
MPAKITYYAIVDDFSTKETPAGVLRRIVDGEGRDDQAFTTNLKWEHSSSLYSYERGNMDVQFYEISEDAANGIVDQIRRSVTGDALSG